eukprot:5739261-Prymnesium_polylepis.1
METLGVRREARRGTAWRMGIAAVSRRLAAAAARLASPARCRCAAWPLARAPATPHRVAERRHPR